jgi:hypothetical protein
MSIWNTKRQKLTHNSFSQMPLIDKRWQRAKENSQTKDAEKL